MLKALSIVLAIICVASGCILKDIGIVTIGILVTIDLVKE